MEPRSESWIRWVTAVVALPLVALLLSTYFIPRIIEKSNKTEALRTARLKKALEVEEHHKDFISRFNVLKTRMNTFNAQNVRTRLSRSELREAQKRFQKEYTDDYLELDRIAWWWYWQLEREGQVLDLLSPEELQGLHDSLTQYGNNIGASVGAISPVWEFLSSSEYCLHSKSQKRLEALEAEMNTKLSELWNTRNELVKSTAATFASSKYKLAKD